MEMRTLGTSDLQVSVVGLGCNNFGSRLDVAATRSVVHRALDAGVTFFDTADIYGNRGGSETQLGEVLGRERQRVVVASKFGLPMSDDGSQQGASRGYVRRALEGSLRRLRTDYLDLYQLHRPDPETPIEETLEALAELVQEGMVRFIGVSNFSAEEITEAQAAAERLGLPGFVSSQDEYSLLVRDLETTLLPTLREHKLGLLPYFPLANGLLTGKYRSGEALPEGARLNRTGGNTDKYLNDANLRVVEKLRAFAEARERTLLELAFSWLLSKPEVASVIAGATKPEQVAQNAQAASWRLLDDELAEVDEITAA
jgi:aryl-alcohol dehydrogenase-like predicted oxidoreductase